MLVRRTITSVVFVIAGLSFAFGFGNGWALGLQLGVSGWIAPLVAPAVDLSVVALLVATQYVRASGVPGRLAGARVLLVFCGLITFALNTATSVLSHHIGRACFDAVAPVLLIGWGEVGPKLLALISTVEPVCRTVPTLQDESTISVLAVPDEVKQLQGEMHSSTAIPKVPGPPSALVEHARQLDMQHQEATGRRISRDRLRAELKVSNAVAGELLRSVRGPPAT